jgi:hypothetical protein
MRLCLIIIGYQRLVSILQSQKVALWGKKLEWFIKAISIGFINYFVLRNKYILEIMNIKYFKSKMKLAEFVQRRPQFKNESRKFEIRS